MPKRRHGAWGAQRSGAAPDSVVSAVARPHRARRAIFSGEGADSSGAKTATDAGTCTGAASPSVQMRTGAVDRPQNRMYGNAPLLLYIPIVKLRPRRLVRALFSIPPCGVAHGHSSPQHPLSIQPVAGHLSFLCAPFILERVVAIIASTFLSPLRIPPRLRRNGRLGHFPIPQAGGLPPHSI